MKDNRIIVAGYMIDGTGAGVRRNVFLAVRDGIIAAIEPVADLPRDEGTAIDDFSHCTLVPALVDCSVSLSRSPSVSTAKCTGEEPVLEEVATLFTRQVSYCHAHGVLGVADSGDLTDLLKRSPPDKNILAVRSSGRLCRSKLDCPADGTQARDFLKVACSDDIETGDAASLPRMSREELRQILSAHRGGSKVVVVANGRQAVAEALAAGCDAIEQGYLMGEDNLRKMAEKNVLWIPGVLRARNALDGSASGGDVCCRFSQRYVAPGKPVPGAEAYWKKMLAGQLAQLRLAKTLGVTTAVGTGAGSTGILHGEAVVEEMKLFIKAGYSLEETIRCATEHGAGFFGFESLGQLAAGRPATFLITRGTPRQLPRKLSYLEGIYINGAPSDAYRKNPLKVAGQVFIQPNTEP
jgi:imidazolonepropionase-like amidohydrolase